MADVKPPAFQFYAQDYLMGTMTMSLAEKGAYADLLANQWDCGAVPGDDLPALARMMRCSLVEAKRVWPVVSKKFDRGDDGLWRNARLERERAKQQAFRERQSENGRKGGRPKSNPGLSSGLTQSESQSEPNSKARKSSSSSSSTSSTPPSKNDGGDTPVRVQAIPLIPRGQTVAWNHQQERQHALCEPVLCRLRGSAVQKCMPAALVDDLAGSITGVSRDVAKARVMEWALTDRPGPGTWSAGAYEYWKERWNVTKPRPTEREDRRGDGHMEMVDKMLRGEIGR